MDNIQKNLVKSTVPILKSSGEILTKHFYTRMFNHNPELKSVFNMGHQASGRQQSALAGAVLAYAENIENPSVLINVLKTVGNKHVSLNVTAEQYDIVGHHLIESIKEVLGELATTDLIEAWIQAYNELAKIMIDIEAGIYQDNLTKMGGWKGWRTFVIAKIVSESEEIKSFYLTPQDGKDIAEFFPGQYISVKTFITELGHEQPRQYSLSTAYNNTYYRISVKREFNTKNALHGIVSNRLHQMREGETLEVSAPAGVFHLNKDANHPLVLISGGVGVTPLMSMLETNRDFLEKNKTLWFHSCRNEQVHAFKKEVDDLNKKVTWLTSHVFYETMPTHETNAREGRIDLNQFKDEVVIDGAKYYICGPEPFIKVQYTSLISLGVDKESIFYEEFGPQLLSLN